MLIPAIKLAFDLKRALALAEETVTVVGLAAERRLIELSALEPPVSPALLLHKGDGVFLTSTHDTSGSLPVYAEGFDPRKDRWKPVWAGHGLSEERFSHRIELLVGGLLGDLREAAADLHSLLCITYTETFPPRVTHLHRGPGTDPYVSGCCPPF